MPAAAPRRGARWQGAVEPLLTVAFGAAFAGVALGAAGGLQLQPVTVVEMILEILSGVLCAAALLIGHGARADEFTKKIASLKDMSPTILGSVTTRPTTRPS